MLIKVSITFGAVLSALMFVGLAALGAVVADALPWPGI